MKRRVLGKTGLEVTELGLGTWGLSGEAYGNVAQEEAKRVIRRAAQMGITLFETSSSYGTSSEKQGGAMERALGEALAELTHDNGIVVVTKLGTDRTTDPTSKNFSRDYLRQVGKKSREHLGNRVGLIALLHNPSRQTIQREEATSALQELAEEGIVTSWGVSAGDQEVAEAALDAGAPILSVPYNIFHVEPLRALQDRIREAGVGLVAHSILAYGLLTGRWTRSKVFGAHDHRKDRWPDGGLAKRIQQLEAVRPLVSGDIQTMRAAAVRFALQNELVSCALLGPRNSTQLDQLVRDARCEGPYLTEAKLHSLENRLEQLGVRSANGQ